MVEVNCKHSFFFNDEFQTFVCTNCGLNMDKYEREKSMPVQTTILTANQEDCEHVYPAKAGSEQLSCSKCGFLLPPGQGPLDHLAHAHQNCFVCSRDLTGYESPIYHEGSGYYTCRECDEKLDNAVKAVINLEMDIIAELRSIGRNLEFLRMQGQGSFPAAPHNPLAVPPGVPLINFAGPQEFIKNNPSMRHIPINAETRLKTDAPPPFIENDGSTPVN